MRFMALLKGSRESEAYIPSKEDAARMGTYIAEAQTAGWLLATEGLHPSMKAARAKLSDGKRAVTDGPFTETKELIASYALMEVGSKEEAIQRCWNFLELIGGGEIEIWQVFEPEDLR